MGGMNGVLVLVSALLLSLQCYPTVAFCLHGSVRSTSPCFIAQRLCTSKRKEKLHAKEEKPSSGDDASTHAWDDVLHQTREMLHKDSKGQDIHVRLVELGMAYKQRNKESQHNKRSKDVLISAEQKVPGCIASVHVWTTLIPENKSKHEAADGFRVRLDGRADALVSGGLLALLSQIMSNPALTAEDVLQINPNTISSQLELTNILSQGRNDGLASMVQTVQSQIRTLLLQPSNSSSPTLTTPTPTLTKPQTHTKKKKKVAMLLSGGVDSSVALFTLLQPPNDTLYQVHAFYLRIWLQDEVQHLNTCPWEDDYKSCQAVCHHLEQTLGIQVPLETISLQEEYCEKVISYTMAEAQKGRTPNPDVMCNQRIKFDCFWEVVEQRGYDLIATGHYALLQKDATTGRVQLRMAPDPIKDQTYFLSTLSQSQLRRALFPLGPYQKSHVRQMALDAKLPNAHRPDSQGLCFLGKVKFQDFLQSYLGTAPGQILDASTGEVIGRHEGVWFHTVGQRKGIGKWLHPQKTAEGPWYVVAKDVKRNAVLVSNVYNGNEEGEGGEDGLLERARVEFEVEELRWIKGELPMELLSKVEDTAVGSGSFWEGRFGMKIRHGPNVVGGMLRLRLDEDRGTVKLDKKDGGLAPGQFVVFYHLDSDKGNSGVCLGSAVISEHHWATFLSEYQHRQERLQRTGKEMDEKEVALEELVFSEEI